jgi:hypothetical protein
MRNCLLLSLALIALTPQLQGAGGWKTILATKQDLKDYPPGQASLENGLLHVRAGNAIWVPQPSPNGAIRARFHFRERTGFPQLRLRRNGNGEPKNSDFYELILMINPGQTSVKEAHVIGVTRGKGKGLGVVPLSEPLVVGSQVDLELSVAGEHLQVLVNGKVAFETNDSGIATGGYWGVAALDAWFSNIQVRSLPLGKSTDPRVVQLQESYEAAIQREVIPAHLEAVKSLNAKYVAALDRALDAATKASNLDGALALRAEKNAMEDQAPLPADDSTLKEPLKSLHLTYRSSLNQLETLREQRVQPLREKFLQAMDAYLAELTRANNLDGALDVRKRREFEAGNAQAH